MSHMSDKINRMLDVLASAGYSDGQIAEFTDHFHTPDVGEMRTLSMENEILRGKLHAIESQEYDVVSKAHGAGFALAQRLRSDSPVRDGVCERCGTTARSTGFRMILLCGKCEAASTGGEQDEYADENGLRWDDPRITAPGVLSPEQVTEAQDMADEVIDAVIREWRELKRQAEGGIEVEVKRRTEPAFVRPKFVYEISAPTVVGGIIDDGPYVLLSCQVEGDDNPNGDTS